LSKLERSAPFLGLDKEIWVIGLLGAEMGSHGQFTVNSLQFTVEAVAGLKPRKSFWDLTQR
jgi:hypothetical protein